MVITSGGIFTLPMGFIAQRVQSLAAAYIVLLGAYVFIAYYSFLGSQVRATGASDVLP